jgi:hypothetical protein
MSLGAQREWRAQCRADGKEPWIDFNDGQTVGSAGIGGSLFEKRLADVRECMREEFGS